MFQPPRRKAEAVRIADGLHIVRKRHTSQTEHQRRHVRDWLLAYNYTK